MKVKKALEKAIEDSKKQVPVWDKINGFDVITHYKTVTDGDILESKIQSIIDLLD
ncbi:hypothetical protein [Vibrio phage LP.1]|nr:hypothetical protein [Vibrio phage LP.1]